MALGISAATWAVIGTTAVTAYSANKSANAQEDAANAARQQSDDQYKLNRQDQIALLAQQREDQAPYRAAGTSALAKIMEGTSTGGRFSGDFDAMSLNKDPGYQFRRAEGEAGINRAAAATGAGFSGATLKALARFNSGLASQEYGAAFDRNTAGFNRLASLAGIGQTATNATQSAGTSAYNNIGTWGANNAALSGRLTQDAGEARASGYVATGNAVNQGIKGLFNAYQMGGGGDGGGAMRNTLF
jgi:hypothetical protein